MNRIVILIGLLTIVSCDKTKPQSFNEKGFNEKLAFKKQYVFSSNNQFESAFAYREDADTLEKGMVLYRMHCEKCHTVNAKKSIAPTLFDNHWIHGRGERRIFNIIQNGTRLMKLKARYNGEPMPPFRYILNRKNTQAIMAWLISKNASIVR